MNNYINVRYFGQKIRYFGQNVRYFGQNVCYFAPNILYFGQNVRYFGQNIRYLKLFLIGSHWIILPLFVPENALGRILRIYIYVYIYSEIVSEVCIWGGNGPWIRETIYF